MMPRQSTTARGYGWTHTQARRAALRQLHDGDPCSLCGHPMWREQAHLLDLDHQPGTSTYRGLAHRHCNRADGATRGNRARAGTPTTRRRSRTW